MVKNTKTSVKPAQQQSFNRKVLTNDTKAKNNKVVENVQFENKETDQKARELQSKLIKTAPTPRQVAKKSQENFEIKDLVKTEKRKDGKMTRSRESYVYNYLKSKDSRIFDRAKKELENLNSKDNKEKAKYQGVSFKQFFSDWSSKQSMEEINEELYVLGCVEFASFLSDSMYGIELDEETKLRIVDDVLMNTIVNNGQDKYEVLAESAYNLADNEIEAIKESQLQ